MYVSSKQENGEDIGPLMNKAGKLVTNNVDKAEVSLRSLLLSLPE